MRFAAIALLPAALGISCAAASIDSELLELRAEIRHLEESIPPEAPLWIHEGPDRFERFIEDYSADFPDFIYHHVVRNLIAMPDGGPARRSLGKFDLEACRKHPERFRGRFWRVSGIVGEIHPERTDTKAAGTDRMYAGVFFDSRMRPVLFHVTDKPEPLSLREDFVETEAIFVKLIEYVTKSGRRVVAPFFIGKSLRRYL
jgi:hypothetical protein